jgi:hypothetical protein
MCLNSPGPFESRRFRFCCSSAVADGSLSLSICWPAKSWAFVAALGLRRLIGRDPASPNSTRRQMASERVAALCNAQSAIWLIVDRGKRALTKGSLPDTGRPLRFTCTFVGLRIK